MNVVEKYGHYVDVDLGERSYQIHIGSGLLDRIGDQIASFLPRSHVMAIVDENAAEHHLNRLYAALDAASISCAHLVLPSGESTKSWSALQTTVEWLLARQVERQDVILGFGGGVINDLSGFAAAILRRGVDHIQLPSTLLAQADSSVGGKTGINSPVGKNLIGSFHQPRLVVCDVELLRTLPRRDFLAGCAEVVKYGLICDRDFFTWLEQNVMSLHADQSETMVTALQRSCEIKAKLVVEDECERGARALLNLGHTFGHALETAIGYGGNLLHGEAVAIGCCLALELSCRLGLCPRSDVIRTGSLLRNLGMKTNIHEIDNAMMTAPRLVELMHQDKKVVGGRLRFVLARGIGHAFLSDEVDSETLLALLNDSMNP
ncbi:MAG: 3-dehydroquinate synthase [Rhodobacteraceae bacterium]|nr:3-dehydroquinate synthase [Paracoccaceae bacterium]